MKKIALLGLGLLLLCLTSAAIAEDTEPVMTYPAAMLLSGMNADVGKTGLYTFDNGDATTGFIDVQTTFRVNGLPCITGLYSDGTHEDLGEAVTLETCFRFTIGNDEHYELSSVPENADRVAILAAPTAINRVAWLGLNAPVVVLATAEEPVKDGQ